MYRSFVSLGRYTPKYFILFVAMVNGIVSLIFLSIQILLSFFHFERGCTEAASCIYVLESTTEEQCSQSQTTRLFLVSHHPMQLVLGGLGCSVGMEEACPMHLNFQVPLLMSVVSGFLLQSAMNLACTCHVLLCSDTPKSSCFFLTHMCSSRPMPSLPLSNILCPEAGYSH